MDGLTERVEPAAGPAGRGLRSYLTALLLVALLPMIVAATVAVMQAKSAFEAATSTRLLETARTLARAAESELEGGATLLRLLSQVPHSVSVPGMVDPWSAAAERQIGGRLVEEVFAPNEVIPDGPGLSHHGVPFETIRRALQSRQVAISNLFVDPGTSQPRIAMVKHMALSDEGSRFAALVVPPERLVQVLQGRNAANSDLLVAVADGAGIIVARTRDPERVIGKPAPNWHTLKAVGRNSGVFEAASFEGRPIVVAFQTLGGTPGWALAVAEPRGVYHARTRGPFLGLLAGALVAVVLGLLVAIWVGRIILTPVAALARRARQIAGAAGSAPTTEVAPSRIAEFEDLRVSLEQSETALRQRADAEAAAAARLAQSEKRYRVLASTGALVFWRRDSAGAVTTTGWETLTGKALSFDASWGALDASWYENLHPDDAPLVRAAWQEAQRSRDVYDIEYRVRLQDGSFHWVRARGSKVEGADGSGDEWIGVIEDVDARRSAQARIAHMAHHDALTGLANRTLFQEKLLEAVGQHGRPVDCAVLCVDIDRFKVVNDTLGHAMGDALLVAVGERLKACIADGDVLARLGADEFGIVQRSGPQPTTASMLASQIIDAVGAPYDIGGQSVVVGASVGIALADGEGADSVLKNADIALDRAKEDGQGRFCFFEPAMNARMHQRQRLERDLRKALTEGQFVLFFQPVITLATGTIAGFEALVRWRHPERGLVSPAEFIPVAEETGLIGPLGRWVLDQACAEATHWPHGMKVAVNVSPRQLADRQFPEIVEAALRRSGLCASRLELEITESTLMADVEGATNALLRLKMMGCSLAMDDFGTGYSSLGYLRTFPFDKVKIDRSFVQDLSVARESGAIIRAVTGLCGSLGIISTAEGVETEAQLALLRSEGCTEGQGYLFGRPSPAEDIPALLAAFSGIPGRGKGEISPTVATIGGEAARRIQRDRA
ncbi:MAG: diguanylate cyclase/phosphodiesterase [Xanthobacteraceae bacterium]|nr:MAG: diguanylate cyclase/phosphodiesterase [Xanthobacteraceae bacterium]